MKKLFLLIIHLTLFVAVAVSQTTPVSATVDKQKILIGEQVQVYLKAVLPGNIKLPWPVVDTFPHFEVLTRSKIDTQQTSQGLLLQQTITLTSWDSGRWMIPPVLFGHSKTKAILMSVEYSPMDANQPYHDIKDIIDVPSPIESNWYWYLLGIAVLIALFMLFFPPSDEKKEKADKPAEDPFKVSMELIGRLRSSDEPKILYTSLVDIFRNYLLQKKNIHSFSKTTDDLARQFSEVRLNGSDQLIQVLQKSDMVKFARYQPMFTENEQAIEVIKNTIISIENSSNAV
jgi:hypothetical protein